MGRFAGYYEWRVGEELSRADRRRFTPEAFNNFISERQIRLEEPVDIGDLIHEITRPDLRGELSALLAECSREPRGIHHWLGNFFGQNP